MSKVLNILQETDHYKIHTTVRRGGGVTKNTKGINAVCPHCGKTGQTQAFHRWHMDNCKMKSDGGTS